MRWFKRGKSNCEDERGDAQSQKEREALRARLYLLQMELEVLQRKFTPISR